MCNTDPSSDPGDHWMVLHASEAGGVEYFDTLGGAIIHDENSSVPLFCGEYRYVSVQTQELFAYVYGQYCIFYMTLRAMGHVLDIQREDSYRFVTCFMV